MARSYQRDGNGRFSSGGRLGGVAKTVQQASKEKKREQRAAKEALSGGHEGKTARRKVNRNEAKGERATTKRMRNVVARAKARFS